MFMVQNVVQHKEKSPDHMDQGIGSLSSSNTPGNLVCHASVSGTRLTKNC